MHPVRPHDVARARRSGAGWLRARASGVLAWACAAAVAGCHGAESASEPGTVARGPNPPTATVSAATAAVPAAQLLTGPRLVVDPNPFKLPPRKIALETSKHVFTFSDQMLATAKLGSTMVLYGATVTGLDGENLVIEGRGGPPYKVHPGYVIHVPDGARVMPGDAIVTEWNGVMKHALVTKLQKDRVLVRYTDMPKKRETALKNARMFKQTDGLKPGNYAALDDGDATRHVLLVSQFGRQGDKKWLVLGFGGAAAIVEETHLKPIPVRFEPKPGATVMAEHLGTMRPAIVVSADDRGLFTVKYDRAGRPALLGWGLVMPEPRIGP